MPPELIAGAAVLVVLVVCVSIAVRMATRSFNAQVTQTWRDVAARRSGTHDPGEPAGRGWKRSQVLDVVVNGTAVRVDTFSLGSLETHEAFTRVRARFVRGGGPKFSLVTPGLAATLGTRTPLGDPKFDAAFHITGADDPAAVFAVWTPRARALMLEHLQGRRLEASSDGQTITMHWVNVEPDARRLEAAIDVVAELAA